MNPAHFAIGHSAGERLDPERIIANALTLFRKGDYRNASREAYIAAKAIFDFELNDDGRYSRHQTIRSHHFNEEIVDGFNQETVELVR